VPYYVSVQSLIDRHGEDAVTDMVDRELDNDANSEALNNAISDAEGEINSYIGVVYDLPLPGVTDIAAPQLNMAVPAVLRRVAVDIAVYRAAVDYGGALTHEKRKRYDDALAWLQGVAAGKTVLGVVTEPPPSAGFNVSIDSSERLFTRRTLRGF